MDTCPTPAVADSVEWGPEALPSAGCCQPPAAVAPSRPAPVAPAVPPAPAVHCVRLSVAVRAAVNGLFLQSVAVAARCARDVAPNHRADRICPAPAHGVAAPDRQSARQAAAASAGPVAPAAVGFLQHAVVQVIVVFGSVPV